jgi:nucleotide-binding universal stress UspA family protein
VVAAPVIACTDGSELSVSAVARGLRLLSPELPVLLVTVMDGPDPAATMGTGHAGPTMTAEQYQEAHDAAVEAATELLVSAAEALDLRDADRRVLEGAVGPTICELAEELSAEAIVLGSRGRGGLRRAVLGSVSDHVVRNAPCPVIVTPPSAAE